MEAARKRRAEIAKAQFMSGPRMAADGKLTLAYIEPLWAFSPAFPPILGTLMTPQQYWAVLMPVNQILQLAAAAAGVGQQDDATSEAMKSGNFAGLMGGVRQLAAEAQAQEAHREQAMQQVQAVLFQSNRAFGGLGASWQLERREWYTTSYTPATQNSPGYSTRVKHVKWLIHLTFVDGPARFTPDAASLIVAQPAITAGGSGMTVNGRAVGGEAITSEDMGNIRGCIMPPSQAPAAQPAMPNNPAYGLQSGSTAPLPPGPAAGAGAPPGQALAPAQIAMTEMTAPPALPPKRRAPPPPPAGL